MPECIITGTVTDLDGNAAANARLTFTRLSGAVIAFEGEVRRPNTVSVQADNAGAVSFTLVPGNYRGVIETDRGSRAFNFGVPDQASANFVDLLDGIEAFTPFYLAQAKEYRDQAEEYAQIALASGGVLDVEDVADLLANTTITYTAGSTFSVAAGSVVRTRAEGFAYRVAASGASDHHVTTAGGVKLYVLPSPDGKVTPQQFGAIVGAADSAVAIEAAAAYADKVAVPTPLNYPSAVTVPNGAYEGPESLVIDGHKAARYRSTVKTEPTRSTAHTFIGTAFDGDYSKVPFPVEHYILGATTLGQPTTGYLYTPEATPHYTYMLNQAGHNQSTTGNDGRTGATAYRTRIQHSGDGDAVAYNASVFVSGAKAGASGSTGWLANPAGVLLNGEVIAGNNGVYLNNLEINLDGGVYDVAGVGCVFNFYRNNATGALGAGWDGIRFQSNGSQPIDCGIRFSGSAGFGVGVNFVQMVSTNSAAIAMAAGQRIYLDAEKPGGGNLFDVTLNDTYMSVPTLGGALVFTVNNNPVLQLATAVSQRTQVLSSVDVRPLAESSQSFRLFGNGTQQFLGAGQIGSISYIEAGTTSTASTLFSVRTANAGVVSDSFVVNSTGSVNLPQVGARYRVNGTDVIGPRRTGWTAPTGTATRTTFDTATVTTAQLAERVKGLIDDLITHGLIGA